MTLQMNLERIDAEAIYFAGCITLREGVGPVELRLTCSTGVRTIDTDGRRTYVLGHVPGDFCDLAQPCDSGCYAGIPVADDRVLLGTDRLGFGPLYYHLAPRGSLLYFASRLDELKDRLPR